MDSDELSGDNSPTIEKLFEFYKSALNEYECAYSKAEVYSDLDPQWKKIRKENLTRERLLNMKGNVRQAFDAYYQLHRAYIRLRILRDVIKEISGVDQFEDINSSGGDIEKQISFQENELLKQLKGVSGENLEN